MPGIHQSVSNSALGQTALVSQDSVSLPEVVCSAVDAQHTPLVFIPPLCLLRFTFASVK